MGFVDSKDFCCNIEPFSCVSNCDGFYLLYYAKKKYTFEKALYTFEKVLHISFDDFFVIKNC